MQRRVSVRQQTVRKPPPVGIEGLRENATQAARLLRALSNENRLMLLCLLFEGERTVGELNESLPLSQSALSQHLAKMREEGVLATRREAQTVFYRIADANAARLLALLKSMYCP